MVRYFLYLLILISVGVVIYFTFLKHDYTSDDATLVNGKILFTKYCSSCHSLEADGFGPPLGGITSVLPKDALVSFIQNPSKVIASKNERAVSQLTRYKRVMPAFEWMQERRSAQSSPTFTMNRNCILLKQHPFGVTPHMQV